MKTRLTMVGIVARLVLLSLILSTPAGAQDVEVGASLLCDTERQTERFVVLFEGDAQRAVHAVNTEANDPTACAVVPTAYIRGRELAMVRTKYGAFRIVRILVLGVVAEAGYQAAAPAVFFSVVKIEEYDV